LLASFYGGITEEILVRLFLFSSLAWLLSMLWHSTGGGWWFINIVVAVMFGVGHLPLARAAMGLTGLTVTRTLLLNGVAGLLFGWLYWEYWYGGIDDRPRKFWGLGIFILYFALQKTRLGCIGSNPMSEATTC
jgi:membrane protease YdiL (CAAX protease family)